MILYIRLLKSQMGSPLESLAGFRFNGAARSSIESESSARMGSSDPISQSGGKHIGPIGKTFLVRVVLLITKVIVLEDVVVSPFVLIIPGFQPLTKAVGL